MPSPVLFDLDGTLVDSRAVVERHWSRFCAREGIEIERVLAIAHGIRSEDTIAAVAPHLDAVTKARELDQGEELDTDGLVAVAGARAALAALPRRSWGIVTSGHRSLASRRLRAVGLPVPGVMVCGDELQRGKPDPEGYLEAARRLGAPANRCVVVEDAPAGVLAGRAADMRVIAVTTTHPPATLSGADAIIPSLEHFHEALARVRAVA
jgi:sugar-phosphatase